MEQASTGHGTIIRGFKASPWTYAAQNASKRIEPVETASPKKPVETPNQNKLPPALALDSNERQKEQLDPIRRRKWIEEVERRPSKQNRSQWMAKTELITRQLSSLPIANKGQVPQAFEFFKNVYIPAQSSSYSSGFRIYCQVILQDAMLFEMMMANALAMQHLDKKPTRRLTPASRYHSDKCVMQLIQRLQLANFEDRNSDTVVMTILLLIASYIMCGDFGPWSLHMKALRRIIEARGGVEQLGWDGYIATVVARVEAAWVALEARKTVDDQAESKLVYPTHPFAPALCSQIAKLPQGFRELSLQSCLSLQFIGALEEVLHNMGDVENPPSSVTIASILENTITRPDLSTIERVLAVALISCSMEKAKAREGVPATSEIGRQVHARSFPGSRGIYSKSSPEEDAYDWAALVLQATTTKDSTAWNWADRHIKSGDARLELDSRRNELQDKFLEIPC